VKKFWEKNTKDSFCLKNSRETAMHEEKKKPGIPLDFWLDV